MILFGRREFEHVLIDAAERMSDGWIQTSVSVSVGPWSGVTRAMFYQGELRHFADEIAVLYETLKGVATLQPMEPYLQLRLSGNGRGQIRVDGEASDPMVDGAKLVFHFELDQTELPEIITGLRVVDAQ